jgi:hypothetical protein
MKEGHTVKKRAGIWLGGTAAAALLMLSACTQKDPDPVGPGGTGTGVGKAEIHLPALPKGFLLKTARQAVDPFFILTISGPGMTPRKHAWPLDSAGGTAVTVENIPVGTRLFTGQIEAGGGIVYGDSVWSQVESGKTALIRLKLARTTGNARICVEIVGLPPPTGCGGRDSVIDVSGCWGFNEPSGATLRIFQQDSVLQGVVTWPGGGWNDTARGFVTSTGYVVFGHGAGGFYFTGRYDGVKSALAGRFFRTSDSSLSREVVLRRTACDSVNPPGGEALLTCHDVVQALDGRSIPGRFTLLNQNHALFGYFQWQGYAGMPVSGRAAPVTGNLGLYLYGNLPTGLAQDPFVSDGVHYKAQVAAIDGNLVFGTIYGTNGTEVQRGIWKGYPVPCQRGDREIIRAVYGQ